MKPKQAQLIDTGTSSERDRCQTPWYALDPLLPYLPQDRIIWESAAGEGYLRDELGKKGYSVVSGDILSGQNFFDITFNSLKPIQVTNPPYSTKYKWLARSYEIGLPFALLMPVDVLGSKTALELFEKHGIEIIFLKWRVDFKMPSKGWDGHGSQFTTHWFTHGLNIGQPMTYSSVAKPSKQEIAEWVMGYEQLQMFA
jgi:hypothetical protein